jgi:tetratricopeptide (TPR) repeat protein
MSGDLLGTLRYMSPEQALAQRVLVDQHTDIYSLGVTLYELLTLEPAFPGADRRELLRQIAFDDPKPPRRLSKAIPVELETIVLKATEKNPTDRYATARELADDLERYLKHEPVRARRATVRQRAAKWMRRHPGVTLTGAVSGFVILVMTVLGLLVNNFLIRNEEARTQKANNQTQEANEHLKDNLKLAMRTLDEIYLKVAEERLPRDPRRQKEDKELLDKALGFYELFAERNSADPAVRLEVCRAYHRVGEIRLLLGEYAAAIDAFGRAIEIAQHHLVEFPDGPRHQLELASNHTLLGRVLNEVGELSEAKSHYREAINLLTPLVYNYPEVADYQYQLAFAHENMGNVLVNYCEWAEAEMQYWRTAELQTALHKKFPNETLYSERLGRNLMCLGKVLLQDDRGGWEESRKRYEQAIDLLTPVVAAQPNVAPCRFVLALTHSNLADLLRNRGERLKANRHFHLAVTNFARLADEWPGVPVYRMNLANNHTGLGQTGQPERAEEHYLQAIELLTQVVKEVPSSPDSCGHLAGSHCELAEFWRQRHEWAKAEEHYLESIRLLAQLMADPKDLPRLRHRRDLADNYIVLGNLLHEKGDLERAADYYRKGVAQYEKELVQHPKIPGDLAGLARFLANCPITQFRDPARAIALARKATEAAPHVAIYWNTFGLAQYRAGNWTDALKALQESMQRAKGGGATDWFLLAMTNWKLGHKVEAREWYGKATESMKNHSDHDSSVFQLETAALLEAKEQPPKEKPYEVPKR